MSGRVDRGNALIGPPERGKRAPVRSEGGRVCQEPTCSTILSTYNASGACWLHRAPVYRHSLYRG